ncbi:MAG: hypothetical protein WC364_10215 [Eubacteriales bacterium]|jgi:hypothetical protein
MGRSRQQHFFTRLKPGQLEKIIEIGNQIDAKRSENKKMIEMCFNTDHSLPHQDGQTLTIRIKSIKENPEGASKWIVDDCTPLPGADPTCYCCNLCGRIDIAEDNGFPPEGWVEKTFPTRHFFICPGCATEDHEPYCRVCGCTHFDPCKEDDGSFCYWETDDLCSKCAREIEKGER